VLEVLRLRQHHDALVAEVHRDDGAVAICHSHECTHRVLRVALEERRQLEPNAAFLAELMILPVRFLCGHHAPFPSQPANSALAVTDRSWGLFGNGRSAVVGQGVESLCDVASRKLAVPRVTDVKSSGLSITGKLGVSMDRGAAASI
jgi:hypothetical protein